MSFEDDLKAAKQADVPFQDVDVLLNKKVYTLRFYRINGMKWANAADKHPIRPGVFVDLRYGYNIRGLVMEVAVDSGRLLDGDEEKALEKEQWDELFLTLDGASAQRLSDAVFELNDYGPQQEIEDAKKARNATAK